MNSDKPETDKRPEKPIAFMINESRRIKPLTGRMCGCDAFVGPCTCGRFKEA